MLHMHLGPTDFAQSSGVVEMPMTKKDEVDVSHGQAEPLQVMWQALPKRQATVPTSSPRWRLTPWLGCRADADPAALRS
jgi:hypothetical protein